jgi:tRNA (cmo5U34)-methyltransferase
MQAEIQRRFTDAVQYDEMMGRIFPGYHQLPLVILSHLRLHLGPRARVLDVGCGTGTALVELARHQSEWSFVGVDPAESLLGLAREKASSAGVGDRLTFADGMVEALPEEPPFDAATCILVEHLQPDDGSKLRLLDGIFRRLRPGGWLVLAGLHGDLSGPTAQGALGAWIQFVALQGLPAQVQEGVRHKAAVEDSLVPEVRIRELLGAAGFVDVERIYQLHLFGAWVAQKPPD